MEKEIITGERCQAGNAGRQCRLESGHTQYHEAAGKFFTMTWPTDIDQTIREIEEGKC